MTDSLERVRAVKRAHEADWLRVPGVVGVGIALLEDGCEGIVVSIEGSPERVRPHVPADVDGVRVELRETGPLRAQ